jgi:hypothetical protein
VDQPIDPALKAETIDEDQPGLCQGCGILRRRLVSMRIAIGADQAAHMDMGAADLLGDIRQHGEARHGIDILRECGTDPTQEDQRTGEDQKLHEPIPKG